MTSPPIPTGPRPTLRSRRGEIFVMGDNRATTPMTAVTFRIGSIDEDYVLGKAVFSLLPFDTIGPL